MLYNDSNKWQDYIGHVLQFEGGLSKNPQDAASSCVPAGQYHTNKGVTYCTFKDRAAGLGISPVTYQRFLNLTDEDAAKFLFYYYNNVAGSKLPDSIALAMTEAGWMSGTDRAYRHLYDALANLGQIAKTKSEAQAKSYILPEKLLFDEYIKVRRAYLNFLTQSPKYAPFKNGWNNRLLSFYSSFSPDEESKKKLILLPIILLLTLSIIYLIKQN